MESSADHGWQGDLFYERDPVIINNTLRENARIINGGDNQYEINIKLFKYIHSDLFSYFINHFYFRMFKFILLIL